MKYFPKILLTCFIFASLIQGGDSKTPSNKRAVLVYDHSSDQVLHEEHADEIRHPASLTKKMTLYIVFQALKSGRLHFHTRLKVSPYAASQEPCKIHLQPGEQVAVSDLIKAVVTKSANDASCVLAEELGKSAEGFVRMMNTTAQELGMGQTVFQNPTGLPHPAQITTARDMLILAQSLLRDFPEYYPLFKTVHFTYNGRTYRNHNRMLGVVPGMEGLKTGFVNASGYNISTSTMRNGRRIFAIVMGGRSWQERNREAEHLIETAFLNSTNSQKPHREQDLNDQPMVRYLNGVEAQSTLQKTLETAPKSSVKQARRLVVSSCKNLSKRSVVKTVWQKPIPKKLKKCSKRKRG